MKRLLTLLLFSAFGTFACGPYFPSSYLSDYDATFKDRININEELKLIAQEYDLFKPLKYPHGHLKTVEAEQMDFAEQATQQGGLEFKNEFKAYATSIRSGDTNAVAPAVPECLVEFVLYLEGTREFKADPDIPRPEAWDELLSLELSNRLYRTTWVHYMLGNLAASHGQPDEASEHYAACRLAALETKKDDSLGLAHASFKREYLAQTNLTQRIERGIAAVGYYRTAWDRKRERFCMGHLQQDMRQAAKAGLDEPSMAVLEAMALFNVGKEVFIAQLESQPDLKITPRLAWFMYKKGEAETAAAYLEHCSEDNALANWLRFRLAQREGRTDAALQHLKKWIGQISSSNRVHYDFGYRSEETARSAAYGSMGALYATKGQMMNALQSFVDAGALEDASLIAERYIETDVLKKYVNSFEHSAARNGHQLIGYSYKQRHGQGAMEIQLSYLLARRLFREGRPEEALPYYPPDISKVLIAYLEAVKQSENIWKGPNTRSAHLYQAARIMRWKGMELSGTALYPDYTIVGGNFPYAGLENEDAIGPESIRPSYDKTAPVPNVRFHYRHIAAELAGKAAKQAWNRHQKAMTLWSAGSWIQKRHPNDADVYYKKLARIRFQPLAKAADVKRWFPEATPLMDYVHLNEAYVPPETILAAAQAYETD